MTQTLHAFTAPVFIRTLRNLLHVLQAGRNTPRRRTSRRTCCWARA
jgi:hypothetical protein